MRFACEQCQTKYSIPDERVRGKILKIRCKTCGCLISVSEGGVRTARPVEAEAGPGLASGESEGGDSTMIGGMADFFGKLAPPTEGEDWHLSVDGNQNGPMPLNDLAQRVIEQAGTSSELFVWKEGFEAWKTADDVPEIQAAVEKARGSGQPRSSPAPSLGKSSPAASLASESEGGDATQIGALNLDALKGDAKGGDDDDVQDASMLSLDADALEAFSTAVAAAKPAAKPAMPPPLKAPPPFKAPAAPLYKTLPHPGGRPLPSAAAPPPKPAAPPSPAAPPPAAAPPMPMAPMPTPAAPQQPEPDLASLFPQSASMSSAAPSNSGLGSASASGAPPPVLPSSEPSVMSALQFSTPMPPFEGQAAPAQPPPAQPAKSGSKVPLIAGLGLVVALCGIGGFAVWSKSGKNKPVVTEVDTNKADAGAAADAGAGADAGTKAGTSVAKNPPKKAGELEGIEEADFKSLLDSGESALGKCYAKALKKDSSLDGATLKVEVEVTAKGKASEVTLDGKEADGKLGKCMQKAIKKWKFAKGPDKKPYKVRFPLTVKE